MNSSIIVVAGATGDLGFRIAKALIYRHAHVRAVVRHNTAIEKIQRLRDVGAEVVEVDLRDITQTAKAISGAACVVSVLAGLRDVIIDSQTVLLEASIKAGVPRFIPSDFAIDFTKLPSGSNRNFDLRREFHQKLDGRPIAATSIYNGAFTEILLGPAPIILFKWKRILYWQDADVLMNFTTIDDTASFTAAAALDVSAPRSLHIAGDQVSARQLATIVSEVSGEDFTVLRAGSLGMLAMLIKIAKIVAPGKQSTYPVWQGMQYLHNMFSGLAQPTNLDNQRYAGLAWTNVKDALIKSGAIKRAVVRV
jgi:nucleoside-diphosphate-sugar epimerase